MIPKSRYRRRIRAHVVDKRGEGEGGGRGEGRRPRKGAYFNYFNNGRAGRGFY